MSQVWFRWAATTVAIVVLFGASSPQEASAQSTFFNGKLTFVHGLPGDDLDTDMNDVPNRLPVDVQLGLPGSLNLVFTNVEFGSFSGSLSLSPSTYQIVISEANQNNPGTGAVLATATLAIGTLQNSTFVFHTSTDGLPTGTLFQNPVGFLNFINSRVVVRHTAQSGPVSATLTSLFNLPGTAALNISAGQQSSPVDLLLGPYTLGLSPAANPQANLVTPMFQFLFPWNTYYYYAVGTPGTDTFQVLVQRVPPSFFAF